MTTFQNKRCELCSRPTNRCLCHLVNVYDNRTRITLLQHKKEKTHKLNSARFAVLGLKNCQMFCDIDFDAVLSTLNLSDGTYVLFPSEQATGLDDLLKPTNSALIIKHLIVIDATWPQAKGIFKRHPILQQLPQISIKPEKPSIYTIRKEPNEQSISTLEAIAHCLNRLENMPEENLLKPFKTLIDEQINAMGIEKFTKYYCA